MTLKDLFSDKNTWAKYGDMDVYSDYVDDTSAAWCGTLLTFAGAEHYEAEYKYSQYGKVLDTPIEIEEGPVLFTITVKTDDYPDFDKRWRYISAMFYDAAGYCNATDWEKYWFDGYEPDTYQYESGIPQADEDEDDPLERIERLEWHLGNALGWVADHVSTADDYRIALEHLGYSGRALEELVEEYQE